MSTRHPDSGPAAPAGDPLLGTVLEGRYRVDSAVARGGMSMVYRGLDLRLARPVAVKVLSPQYAAEATFLARFEREARAAAQLDDPTVVGVYDQGRDHDHVFLVMELVDGGTLRDLLRAQSQLPLRTALSVLEPVLDALTAAHRAGIIHRDIKPENVLISHRGEVKVADFGVARALTSTTMATGNVILGTVAYLSPEQVETGASDERSDVYSAGIVAYEMLTGTVPFDGETPVSVAYQHVHSDVPSVTRHAPGVPAEIAALIDAATSRDPLQRPANADAFVRRLRAARSRAGLALTTVSLPRHEPPAPETTRGATSRRSAGRTRTELPTGHTAVQPASTTPAATRITTRRGPSSDTTPAALRRRGRWRRRIIALVVIALLAAGASWGGWWLAHRWTDAPAAVSLDRAAAVSAVTSAGLTPTVTTRYDDTIPSGTIAAMTPSAEARLRRGATVTLVVSAGRPTVPDIDPGSTTDAAAAALRQGDLRPTLSDDANIYSITVAAGAVIGTDPAAGTTVPVGSSVTIIVSKGPAPETVPTVAGKAPEDAQNKLRVAGFTIGPAETRFDASVPSGTVIGTDPAAGDTAPHGSAVSLVLAQSMTVPTPSTTAVADVVAAMRHDGFDVTIGDPVFDASVPAGQVVRLDPTPGTRLDPSHPRVTIIGSNAVTVPSLTGESLQHARTSADRDGLELTEHSLFGRDSSVVTQQDPAPGTLVAPGSTVTVTAWP